MTLAPCPCGKVPNSLTIVPEDREYAFALGACCGEWHVKFRTNYKPLHSPECMALAQAAWNDAPRGTGTCTLTEGEDGVWRPACPHENRPRFYENTPRYCPYCGKLVEAVSYQEEAT